MLNAHYTQFPPSSTSKNSSEPLLPIEPTDKFTFLNINENEINQKIGNEIKEEIGVTENPQLEVEEFGEYVYAGYYSHEDRKTNYAYQEFEMERLGMLITSGTVHIKKDPSNLIGISIGGGAPLCPCLYIVQIFDGTPAALEGSLQSGDELISVNGHTVKGKTKVEVAKMIKSAPEEVTINYNKLHVNTEQGKSLDIYLKKLKHRLVDSMSSSTADTLGLSRAILCNDSLVKRLQELEATENMYRGLVDHCKRVLKAHYDLFQTYLAFGNTFASISVHETQPRASEAFRLFAELHRNMEKDGVKMLKAVKPVIGDLGTYLNKAIPDTKLTVKKYADAKFTYLSYCLKVKEMDDEEHSYAALQEPLYRVETGNYEYRLILRCRQESRTKFARLRNDVLEKMELLENKHATDLSHQLKRFIDGLIQYQEDVLERLNALPTLFPIEVDLSETAFQYKTGQKFHTGDIDDDDDDEDENDTCSGVASAIEATEQNMKSDLTELTACSSSIMSPTSSSCLKTDTVSSSSIETLVSTNKSCLDDLLSDFQDINLNSSNPQDEGAASLLAQGDVHHTEGKLGEALLIELGLTEINLTLSNEKEKANQNNDMLKFDSVVDLLQ
ncbi:PRKCA-binding protein isoform X2 [Condylostylus longicornis]|uniref:PRKCA-binding protein isoform X2 n=1 Tax=Condylostylus longicornis TaxID=2530218 RepID=UPI00244DAB5A|nr:PRKCA-binding protein isoform X2 [Condylostylus longicornis]